MTNIASGEFINSLIVNTTEKVNAKFMFYKTYSGLGLLISKACVGSYVAIANIGSNSIKPDLKFPSSKSNCTDLNKWQVISVTWSNRGENLSNCWSNGEKLMTFTTGNIKGSGYCYIGDLVLMSYLKKKTHLTGCIGEIIGFYRRLKGYVHTGTISYRYRTGLIFGTEKLTVHTGPVLYRTSFGTCSHGYGIVSFRSISRQNKQKKI